MAFRDALIMPDGRRFGTCMADFQREDFKALDSGRWRHGYLERGRGGSKTTDLAAEAVCELFLGDNGGRLYASATDRDQAGLLHEAAVGWLRRTPGLSRVCRVERWRIILPLKDAILTVLAADERSAWGLQPTWICADELAMWPEGSGEELWHALFTAAPKRNARVLTISTPGWDRTSLCWRVRELADASPNWYFSVQAQPAPWIPPERLEEMRQSLPVNVYERLFGCRWVEGSGGFLLADEVDKIFGDVPAGPGETIIGLDVGVAHDRTVLAAVRRDQATGLIAVDHLETWQPRPGRPVDLIEVEDAIATLAKRLGVGVVYDPFQAVLLTQRLQARGVRTIEFPFTQANRQRLFSVLLDVVRNGRLKSRPHTELRKELLTLEVEATAAGTWRVDHRPGRFDDHVVAVGLGVQAVAQGGVFEDAPVIVGYQARPSGGPWVSAADAGYFPTRGAELADEEDRRNPW